MRIDYTNESSSFYKMFLNLSLALKEGSIETNILYLINLRASQLNGCAFCVDMHVKQARIAGERELRLYHVAIWRESTLFSPRERAALEWTEILTLLPSHGIPDDVFARVREHLTEKELSDLTFAIVTINGWNRLSIGFRAIPGSQDEVYGLSKAALS